MDDATFLWATGHVPAILSSIASTIISGREAMTTSLEKTVHSGSLRSGPAASLIQTIRELQINAISATPSYMQPWRCPARG
jgi:hypothetical protein